MKGRVHIGSSHFQAPYHNVLRLHVYFYEDIAKIKISSRNVKNLKEIQIVVQAV